MKVSKMTRMLSFVFLLFAFFVFYPGVTKGEHPWDENNLNPGNPLVEPPPVIEDPTVTDDPDVDDPDPGDEPPEPDGTSINSNWWESLWDWMTGNSAGTNASAG
ncbi:MAG: hypothetical protein V3V99_09310 [candidate division Zixibacteria bacterium]